jgi:hypothetical protein
LRISQVRGAVEGEQVKHSERRIDGAGVAETTRVEQDRSGAVERKKRASYG